MSADTPRIRALASGRVQGVGYRWFVQARAQALGLTGGVRNLSNGDVEVVAQGPRSALDALLENLREGPMGADVSDVRVKWGEGGEDYKGFDIWGSW